MCCRLYDKEGLEVNTLQFVVHGSWKIRSVDPAKPLSCMVRQWARYLWYSIWYIVLSEYVSYVVEYLSCNMMYTQYCNWEIYTVCEIIYSILHYIMYSQKHLVCVSVCSIRIYCKAQVAEIHKIKCI